jgi:hypothetical protein
VASIKAYVVNLWDTQTKVAKTLGADLSMGPLRLRAAVLAVDVTIAVVIKTLTDNGVITDTQLQTTLTAAHNAVYKQQWSEPPGTDTGDNTQSAPPLDLGA